MVNGKYWAEQILYGSGDLYKKGRRNFFFAVKARGTAEALQFTQADGVHYACHRNSTK